jgi:hypothetical protein
MPTLDHLQHTQLLAKPRPSSTAHEEIVADHRAHLRPSQFVERKLAAHGSGIISRSIPSAGRPRAK